MAQQLTTPHNLEAEQSVLGAVFLDETCLAVVARLLESRDFYVERHRLVYAAMRSLFGKGVQIDLMTVIDELQGMNKLDAAGGPAGVSEFSGLVSTAANVEYWAKIVRQQAALGRYIVVLRQIAIKAAANPDDVPAFFADANTRLLAETSLSVAQDAQSAKEVFGQVFEEFKEIKLDERLATGLDTGIDSLTRKLGGLQPAEVTVLAGRPGRGKTALALNIAEVLVLDLQVPVLFFSLEMTARQLMRRLISSRGGIDGNKVMVAKFDDDQWKTVREVGNEMGTASLWIDSNGYQTTDQIIAAGAYYQHRFGSKLIVVDHAGLVAKSRSNVSSYDHVTEVSRGMKRLAKSTDTAVLLVVQFSRKVEDRMREKCNPRPRLSDLKGSGSLEEDAAAVVGTHWPWKSDSTKPTGVAELIILKNRFGPTGIVEVQWDGPTTRYSNLAMEETPF